MTNFASYYWLGKPGGRVGMVQGPLVNVGTTIPMNRGEQSHDLISGGITTFKAPLTKRAWQFQRDWLSSDEQEVLRGFYSGLFDVGPFRFYDPSEVNLLDEDASTFGRATSDLSFWKPTTATYVADTDTSTRDVANLSTRASAMVQLSAITAAGGLGSNSALLPFNAVPVLTGAGMPFSFSIYAIKTAGTGSPTIQPYIKGANTVSITAVAVSTSLTRYTITATAAALGVSNYIDCGVVFPVVGSGLVVKLCAPQLEMGSIASPYRIGYGVASVSFNSGITQTVPRTRSHSASWTLAEI